LEPEEEVEPLLEQRLVVSDVVAEQAERVDRRGATQHQLRATVRDRVHGGELATSPKEFSPSAKPGVSGCASALTGRLLAMT
jgi:hypothetical protein